jgi:SAM-dependent methyltransferase
VGLKHVKETFEHYGRTDPMYAVLTDHTRRGGKWDPADFFAHGREEIARVMHYLESTKLAPAFGHALDFGCGVGRLSQALAAHFTRVTGVDISSTMVQAAQQHNAAGDRVTYVMNDVPHLERFESGSFDLVYSNITLQHVPPEPALGYIGEFVRLLSPNGLALFQVRIGTRVDPGTVSAWWYRVRREHLRRLWQRMRGRIPYEMHFVSRAQVEEVVAAHGGQIVDVVDMSRDQSGKSLRFAVRRVAAV